MKKQLITITQSSELQCDNPRCDFSIKNATGDPNTDSSQYINMPCPECGENLLTAADYIQYQNFMKMVNWVNKYFSWLCYLIPGSKVTRSTVHIHDGYTITNKQP